MKPAYCQYSIGLSEEETRSLVKKVKSNLLKLVVPNTNNVVRLIAENKEYQVSSKGKIIVIDSNGR